jgi:hypothetical protein
MNLAPRYTVVPLFMLRVLGVFVPIMRELHEMAYQYDRDYVFDSSKFEKRFSFQPTPYGQGVKQCIQADTLLPSPELKKLRHENRRIFRQELAVHHHHLRDGDCHRAQLPLQHAPGRRPQL